MTARTVKNISDLSQRGLKIRFHACMKFMLYYVDIVTFLNLVTNVCSQDHGMVK